MIDAQTLIYAELAELARTLGHAHRLMLLEQIGQGERPVERLAELSGLSIANASQHLQHLRRAGLVESRRDGKRVLYRLGGGPIVPLLAALRRQAEHRRAEIRDVLADSIGRPERLEGISREELVERLREGGVTLLDVRPEEEFALGHLPGALNIPVESLERRLAELPSGQEIVAYCRGPYCVLSVEAVAALRARGFAARRLRDGFLDWKAAGMAVEAAG
ncbi:metalloregulator ArsR/SmtB family transcription factor [Inquilinus sp. Marseille-Q2685]|uniref:ArsR/SmtB family transcription factor n=1 Tax=Inquilinus sp. Marseille-Q2685 TaxID=2866581 RepID=UPI001CE3F46D|nr:metalloregulator ArsR/SmtB family transcription factor [Inquilinus sp. Marseille-Q2685]